MQLHTQKLMFSFAFPKQRCWFWIHEGQRTKFCCSSTLPTHSVIQVLPEIYFFLLKSLMMLNHRETNCSVLTGFLSGRFSHADGKFQMYFFQSRPQKEAQGDGVVNAEPALRVRSAFRACGFSAPSNRWAKAAGAHARSFTAPWRRRAGSLSGSPTVNSKTARD